MTLYRVVTEKSIVNNVKIDSRFYLDPITNTYYFNGEKILSIVSMDYVATFDKEQKIREEEILNKVPRVVYHSLRVSSPCCEIPPDSLYQP